MSLNDLLSKQITVREGIDLGIISCKALAHCDIYMRVQRVIETENLPKTHAIERVAEMCKVSENTVWRSYKFTAKIMGVE